MRGVGHLVAGGWLLIKCKTCEDGGSMSMSMSMSIEEEEKRVKY